ncbi:MAG: DUF4160 domain-containing protein [Verrucomicrobiota bacterium]|nr:DUF4160 domain-containing protein [Verrucomicrobiota bacterium]
MPTVLQIGPYRFFFHAGNRNEPAHVHVERDQCKAKFRLDPVRLERSGGFRGHEINHTWKTSRAASLPAKASGRSKMA